MKQISSALLLCFAVFLMSILPATSQVVFSGNQYPHKGEEPIEFSIADVDGDGRPDMIVAHSD